MNKLLPPPVDTSVEHRSWWGKRVSVWWMTSTAGWAISGLVLASALGICIYGVIFPSEQAIPGSVTAVPAASAPVAPAARPSDLMPSPAVTCVEQPAVEVQPESLINTSYITTWYPVGTMSAPRSDAAGPNQARRCFARTPEGALYASVTRFAEEGASTGLVQQAAEQGVTGIRFSGYQWLSFTPDRAVLVVRMDATSNGQTRQSARVVDATWTSGDWQVAPDDSVTAMRAATDPNRIYTPWGEN